MHLQPHSSLCHFSWVPLYLCVSHPPHSSLHSSWPFFPSTCSYAAPPPQPTHPAYHAQLQIFFFLSVLLPLPQTCSYTEKDNDIFIPGCITASTGHHHPRLHTHSHSCTYSLESLNAPEFSLHLLPRLKDTLVYLSVLHILHIYTQPPLPHCPPPTFFFFWWILNSFISHPETYSRPSTNSWFLICGRSTVIYKPERIKG